MTRLADVSVGGTITAADTNATRQMVNKTMQLMTPTSVVNASIGTYGAVTISGASSVSLNGVFTSEFDWYAIEFDLVLSGAGNLGFVLRAAGTDASSGYDAQKQTTVNTTVTGAQSLNQSSVNITQTAIAGRHSGTVKLFRPAIAEATTGTVLAVSTPNPMTTSSGMYVAGIQHRTTTAYDGFTITPSTGNITGTIRVYGII